VDLKKDSRIELIQNKPLKSHIKPSSKKAIKELGVSSIVMSELMQGPKF
jgi:hypothetical protein